MEVVEALLWSKADVNAAANATTINGLTPLMRGAWFGDAKCFAALLRAKATEDREQVASTDGLWRRHKNACRNVEGALQNIKHTTKINANAVMVVSHHPQEKSAARTTPCAKTASGGI